MIPMPRHRSPASNMTSVKSLRAGSLHIALLAAALTAGCSDALGPEPSAIEIAILSGNGQFVSSGGTLTEPLMIVVRRVATGEPMPDVTVRWEVVAGDGASLERSTTVTDSMGHSSIGAQLGTEFGTYEIEADFTGRAGDPSRFELFSVPDPEILEMQASALAGETIRIGGRDFRPDPGENSVLFSGFRGEVLSGTTEELMVRVPACLPTRSVAVSIRLGPVVRSEDVALSVEAQGDPVELQVGQHLVMNDPETLSCIRLAPGDDARYLAVPHSSSTLEGGQYTFGLFGLPGSDAPVASVDPGGALPSTEPSPGVGDVDGGDVLLPQARWDAHIRALERKLLRSAPGEAVDPDWRPSHSVAPAPPPSLGERRTFSVLNENQQFTDVTSEVVHVSEHAILYQDITAPDGGFTPSDFVEFGAAFDDVSYPTVTGVFGAPSDIDENGRIIVLFTSVVNGFTAAGSNGFIGGFFFGRDLIPEGDGSNAGEIFYALVPDPQGELGDARSRDLVLRSIPSILAHEFQHMIHFNQRVLLRGQRHTEALWLSEALAQMAEDVVGEAYAARNDFDAAERFRNGNRQRARRYLERSASVSLVPITGGGTLEERGGGWLLLRYLRGQSGSGDDLLRALTQTTLSGVTNVQTQTGRDWRQLLSSWSAAIYLSGLGLDVASRLDFLDIDLRAFISAGGTYPLQAQISGPAGFVRTGTLRSSAPGHFIVRPGIGGAALTLAGPDGLLPASAGRLGLTLVRLQ